MTTEDTYNGWTNRETWCVHLWLTNEEWLYQNARSACSQPGEMLQEAAQSLNDWVDDELVTVDRFQLDMLNAALSRVNWREIVEALKED